MFVKQTIIGLQEKNNKTITDIIIFTGQIVYTHSYIHVGHAG